MRGSVPRVLQATSWQPSKMASASCWVLLQFESMLLVWAKVLCGRQGLLRQHTTSPELDQFTSSVIGQPSGTVDLPPSMPLLLLYMQPCIPCPCTSARQDHPHQRSHCSAMGTAPSPQNRTRRILSRLPPLHTCASLPPPTTHYVEVAGAAGDQATTEQPCHQEVDTAAHQSVS